MVQGDFDDEFDRRPGWQLPGSAPDPSGPVGSPSAYGGPSAPHPPPSPHPAPQPPVSQPPAGPPTPSLPGAYAGEARTVATTTTPGASNQPGQSLVTFRLEQRSASAGRAGLLTVRLRGDDALGFVSEGDWVEVEGKLRRGFVEARRAVNRTSGAEFKGPGAAYGCARVVAIVAFFIVFFTVLGFILWTVVAEF